MSPAETEPPVSGEAPDDELPPGFAVGEYRVESLLGRGGMGTVYGAVQPEIGARVAIKVLARELSRDPRLVRRFVDEARAANNIRHPNIIDIFAFGHLADGRQYFVMEHLDGETLGARLGRGPLPVSDARRLLLQACEALEAAHAEGVVHRDLKPENLWIATPKHGQPYFKVLDFGVAKLFDGRETALGTEAGVAIGTPYYMSPEQCQGGEVDQRTDIYAMGVLLYLMWAGRLPFEGATFLAVVTQQVTAMPAPPSTHRPMPPRLETLILRCLEKDPARRPQSAKELGAALDAALTDALPGDTLAAVSAARRAANKPHTTETRASGASARTGRGRGALVAGAIGVALLVAAGAWLASRPTGGAAPAVTAAPVAPAPSVPAAAPVAPAPTVAAPSPPAPARPHERRVAPDEKTPASRLDERGYAKENPFK